MWGESFEGCVPGYGSAWAHGLRLEIPPAISFDHCVCDAPFMYQARPRGALLVHLGPSDHSMHGAVVWRWRDRVWDRRGCTRRWQGWAGPTSRRWSSSSTTAGACRVAWGAGDRRGGGVVPPQPLA
jgi:hypothetical protein